MAKYILILTQALKNESVDLLERSLLDMQNKTDRKYTVLKWAIDKVTIKTDTITYDSDVTLPISEIALAIKRTWGPIRTKALLLCQQLEQQGVIILNGCQFIEWTHSKILQYQHLENEHLFPKSLCFNADSIETVTQDNYKKTVKKIMNDAEEHLRFPMVLKTNKGCRADGIFLLKTNHALEELLEELFISMMATPSLEFREGFLLQEFILTHPNPSISNYFRLNIVNGKPQSAVQFQLKWQPEGNHLYEKLVDFQGCEDKPINLTDLPISFITKVIQACPCKNGVVGVDLICYQNSRYLLEFNDGPAIALIIELAKTAQLTSETYPGIQACNAFANEIATLCYGLIQPEKQPKRAMRALL